MQTILTNIVQGFLINGLISEQNCLEVINKILLANNEIKMTKLIAPKNKQFNIKKHLEYIEDLRKYFTKKLDKSIEIENKINETLGSFIPSQDEINLMFTGKDEYEKLLMLSLVSYYIKEDKNDLNVYWDHNSKYGKIKISINKAKPEKTQAQIILEKNYVSKNLNEPKCPICIENINFKGSAIKDSRENLRVILTNLNNGNIKDWFFQYSPYSYVNKHFVLNSIEHQPMIIDNNTIKNLVYFIDKNNDFFLGSNADLPIVGGSLLGHNHYQGGQDTLPIMEAKSLESFIFKGAKIDILNWPLNAIKISIKNKEEAINISNFFINEWKSNSDYGLKTINNSTTIIAKKNKGIFDIYLIFRNNSTSESRPFGNFHIKPAKFNIKQENIGLMEAAGLAILPKRLESELQEIIEIFNEKNNSSQEYINLILKNERVSKHGLWIEELIKGGLKINKDNLLKEVSNVFLSCLEDCKVLPDKKFVEFIKNQTKQAHEVYTVKNNVGLFVEVLHRGFTIKQIKLNNKNFLLEYQDINSYFVNNDILLNSFVGPVAGRIENGLVKFDKKLLQLKTDQQNNYIHGMKEKWSDLDFEIQIKSFDEYDLMIGTANQHNLELDCYFSIQINLKVWLNKNVIDFEYIIKTNKTTICNPTQHFYWVIPNAKNIFDININFQPKHYWNLNKNFNPIEKNEWIKKDTKNISQIRDIIGDEQVNLVGNGIDHPIELKKGTNITLSSVDGKQSIVSTSKISNMVLYTHNWKSANILLKAKKDIHQGLCIEYQEIPTSVNNPNFKSIIIDENNPYVNNITYEFKDKV